MESPRYGHTGDRLAAVSNAVVGILRETYGRGPTKAKSYLNDNILLVVLEDILTTVEKTLVANDHEGLVREVRLDLPGRRSGALHVSGGDRHRTAA